MRSRKARRSSSPLHHNHNLNSSNYPQHQSNATRGLTGEAQELQRSTRERPSLALAADGSPAFLVNGVSPLGLDRSARGRDWAFTLVQRIERSAGDGAGAAGDSALRHGPAAAGAGMRG